MPEKFDNVLSWASELDDEAREQAIRTAAMPFVAGHLALMPGLGNPASYNSCSHGAGRRMSRGQARRTLDAEGLDAAMDGVAWNHDPEGLLDEDPRAYKDIDVVMADQRDLVTIEHTLHQILNYKGQ